MTGPDPSKIYPNENLKQIVYVKNVITRPNIIVGDYTYGESKRTLGEWMDFSKEHDNDD